MKAKGEKFHFELIASSGKIYFNAISDEEKVKCASLTLTVQESWNKSLMDAIDRSHKHLLSSAFAG